MALHVYGTGQAGHIPGGKGSGSLGEELEVVAGSFNAGVIGAVGAGEEGQGSGEGLGSVDAGGPPLLCGCLGGAAQGAAANADDQAR